MIKIHVPTGLPTPAGKLEFRQVLTEHARGMTLDAYLAGLHVEPAQLSHVIYGGAVLSPVKTERRYAKPLTLWRRITRQGPEYIVEWKSDLELVIPHDGDEFHLIPTVDGKNSALILGLVGAVIGGAISGGALTPAGFQWGMAVAQGAFYGYAIGSTVGSFLTPKPPNVRSGDDAASSYVWRGIDNEDREGVPVPIVTGKIRTGIVRVGAFIRRDQNTTETLHVLGLVSKGPIESISEVRINDQPYTNYQGVSVETRLGTAGQDVLEGFNAVANTYPQSVELTVDGYIYSTRPGKPVDAIELLLTIPQLFHTTDKGEMRDNTTRFRYRYRAKGGAYGAWIDEDYKAHSRTTILPTYRIDKNYDATPLTRGEYDVEIQFVSATNVDEAKDAWKVFLTGVTEQLNDERTYDGYAMIAIRALATKDLNGSIPNISLLCEGIKLEAWNGAAFETAAFTSGGVEVGRSPAWVALKFMRDPDFGLGPWITDDEIDLDSFKTLADRAKEAVTVKMSDGTTYDEPRFLFDAVLNQEQRALDLLRSILSTCRAFLTFSGNKWRVVCEMPKTPVQLFTMGNIVKDSFQIVYNADRSINALEPQFFDDAHDYAWTTYPTIDGPGVTKYGNPRRSETQQFLGITRASQLVRESLFALNKRWYLRRMATWGAGTAGVLAEAGDNVLVQHDIPQWGFGGTAMGGSSDTYVELGREVTLEAGKTYKLTVRFQDGSHDEGEERIVADGAGTYSGLYVTVPFSQAVQENDVWAFGEVVAKPFTIIEIAESEQGADTRQLTAVEYNESIESDAEEIIVPVYSSLPKFLAAPPPITDASAHEEISLRSDGRWSSTVIVQWTPPPYQDGYGTYDYARVEISYDGGTSWQPAPNGARCADDYRINDAEHGTTFWFRITPVSTRSVANPAGAKTCSVTTQGKSEKPPVPTGFTASHEDGVFLFKWDAVAIDNLADREVYYELRTSNPADWKADTTGFLERVRTTRWQIDDPTQRSYTIYLKAVDKFGNYSAGAASATITDAAPAAPSITSITRFKNSLKVKVGAAPDPDVVMLHLHASQSSGFNPSNATLVSGTVGPNGGEFVVPIEVSGTWYFKVTAEDWLSQSLGDWIYSPQASSSILIILPVDPTGVGMTITVSDELGNRVGDDGRIYPTGLVAPVIAWSFTDAVNPAGSLVGFEIIIYKTSDGYTKPAYDSGVLADPAMRSVTIKDGIYMAPATNYTAAVKACYVDGFTSNLVTDAGQVIPLDTNPATRDDDDRNIWAYAESFTDLAALPTGVSLTGATGPSISSAGISFVQSGTSCALTWDLGAWAAAYLDNASPNAFQKAMIRMSVNTNLADLTVHPSLEIVGSLTGGFTPLSINDQAEHTYVVDWGTPFIGPGDVIIWHFPAGFLPAGTRVYITAIAVGTEDFDSTLDGFMDRAQNARDQFDRDAVGGGYFLQSPVRLTDDNTNVTLVEKNGVFWVGIDGVESPYKRARRAILRAYVSGTLIAWDDATYLDPPLPTPHGHNKVRMIVQRMNSSQNDVAITNYPLRHYVEATEIGSNGFRIALVRMEGGAITVYRDTAPAGNGWTASNQRMSLMALHASPAPDVNVDDAWYSASAGGVGGTHVIREVLWLAVDMPLVTKPNGSYYWVEVTFQIYGSNSAPATANPLTLAAISATNFGQVKMRCYTDGKRWRMPWLHGVVATNDQPWNWKVDWIAQSIETGGGSPCNPTRVLIDAYEQHYISGTPFSVGGALTGQDVDLLFLEEF